MNRAALKRILEGGTVSVISASPDQALARAEGDRASEDPDLAAAYRLLQRDPKPVEAAFLLAMPLGQYEQEGRPLEIRVSWFSETLWFVPTQNEVKTLTNMGIGRGRIWTSRELAELLSLPSLSPQEVQTIAQAKLMFEGHLEVNS